MSWKSSLLALAIFVCCSRRESTPRNGAERTDPPAHCVNDWQSIAEGIQYRTLNCSASGFDLHLVRVDLQRATVDAVVQPDSSAAAVAGSASFAMNANFFDQQLRPLGVVVSHGAVKNRLHPVSWQSVFYVSNKGRANIVPSAGWKNVSADAVTAVQAGPRFVVGRAKNQVVRARPDWRSGVCVEDDTHAIFFATPPESQFDVWQMADKAMAMRCRDAMLFDGGPSTQFFVRLPDGLAATVNGVKEVPVYLVGSSLTK